MTTNETSTNEAAMTMEVLQRTAEILIHVADKGSVKYGNTINSYKQSPHINKMNLQNRWNKRRISYRHWKLKIDIPTSDSVVLESKQINPFQVKLHRKTPDILYCGMLQPFYIEYCY
jgi:hypothetical protein